MKKILLIPFCHLTLFACTQVNAQKNDSYLLLNYNIKPANNYYYSLGSRYRPIYNRERISNFGLQWIKNNSNEAAWRFGFTIYEDYLFTQGTYTQIVDTGIAKYSGYDVLLPKFSVGKEWQKHIHKDVTVYAGADLGVGFMKNAKMDIEERSILNPSQNSYSYSYAANQVGSRWILNISARPFAGMRMNFSRFTLGYEASVPRDYTTVLGENLKKSDRPTLNHQISMGFKLGKMRTKK